jgi:hypothetical protein
MGIEGSKAPDANLAIRAGRMPELVPPHVVPSRLTLVEA